MYVVEPTLERSHGLTKRLLARTRLTNGCSSSRVGKVSSKSHPTAPNEDGQADGGRFVALCPQSICMGEPRAGARLSFSPSRNGQGLVPGVDAVVLVAARGLSGGRSDAFQLKLVRQRYFKYIGLTKMVVSFAGAD